MKSGRTSTALIFQMACSFLFFCTPVSKNTQSDEEEPTSLMISLEEPGRTSAEFSGAPIPALIELDVDTFFNVLDWHTGQGHPIFSDSLIHKKALTFSVLLTWNKYPLFKDSTTGFYCDTVYVSIGGSLKKSNKVYIKVLNLPVIVDSLLFNGIHFEGGDTTWDYTFPETVPMKSPYSLRLFARDLDNQPLSLQVLGPKKGNVFHNATNSMEMEYEPPSGDFSDTVSFMVYDQKGGQLLRQLFLTYLSPNMVPVIDSLIVKSTILKGSGIFQVGFNTLDSLKLQLYAHDSLGTIKQVSWKSKNQTIKVDPLNKMVATWTCAGQQCTNKIDDTVFVIDTVTIKIFDDRNDSTIKYLAIHKGTINQPPVLQKMQFNGKNVSFIDSIGSATAIGGTAYHTKIFLDDPENDSLHITWNTSAALRLSEKTDSSMIYSTPEQLDTDTVQVSISDGNSTISYYLRIVTNDVGPILDSILIDDSLYRNPDTITIHRVTPNDTLLLFAYSYDRDKQDSLTFQWTAGKKERFTARLSSRAKYIVPATDVKDTIILTLQDGIIQTVRKIILLPVNKTPVLDSILSNGEKMKNIAGMEIMESAVVSDTIQHAFYAHDPDNDKITYQWSMSDMSRLSLLSENAFEYICTDTNGIDTISVIISDSQGATIIRKLIVKINLAE